MSVLSKVKKTINPILLALLLTFFLSCALEQDSVNRGPMRSDPQASQRALPGGGPAPGEEVVFSPENPTDFNAYHMERLPIYPQAQLQPAEGFPGTEGYVQPQAGSGSIDFLRSRELNWLLGFMGVPSLPEKVSGEDYDYKAYRPHSLGSRLKRNPDGSYGSQSSTVIAPQLDSLDTRLMDMAVSAGTSAISAWTEGWLASHGNAKVSLALSTDGFFSGSIDYLSPIYDSTRTAVFSQFGVRTMPGKRIIGNLGLGQRVFFNENTMALGYNIFLDQDFTRGHIRGGAGMEYWWDWVRLSANYYKPLSSWRPSKDLDGSLFQERPAEGWDARVTGYLPFYRNLAINAAMEEWYGDHVAAGGSVSKLSRNPKVWEYGLAWTPIPILTISGQNRSWDGRNEASVFLTFNYRFGVPIDEQLRASNVPEARSVDGSRHDFVNRQNNMYLEYRAIPGKHIIKIMKSPNSAKPNVLLVKIYDAWGNPVNGQVVGVAS
ncbi:MAG: inverse autotransporter beta domain-containing protein [Deltaproteobacteria bacterium]|jgi:hypothetical protein|nr:inverse autotransporter beta domain-containing protein [Deltaproteobacteria bacterium]